MLNQEVTLHVSHPVRRAARLAAVLIGMAVLAAAATPADAQQQKPGLMLTEVEEARRLWAEATQLMEAKRFREAIPIWERYLGHMEAVHGPAHPEVATALHNLAVICVQGGDAVRAEALLLRSLGIREKLDGPSHPSVAHVLGTLGSVYHLQRDFARAEPLLLRALTIRESALGMHHRDVADSLDRLAQLYLAFSQHARAEPFIQRLITNQEVSIGPDHPDLRSHLSLLARVYMKQRKFKQAEPLLQRILSMTERALGADHPDVALALNNLGGFYYETMAYDRAAPLLERSLAICEKTLPATDPRVSDAISNLAGLYQVMGDFDRAASMFRRALRAEESVLDPHHPQIAITLENLAVTLAAQGSVEEATRLYARGLEIQDRLSVLVSTVATREQRLAHINELTLYTFIAASLHMRTAPHSPTAARAALTAILRRKGKLIDAEVDTYAALRDRLDRNGQARLDHLSSVRSKLTALRDYDADTITKVNDPASITALELENMALENELGAQSAEFRAEQQPVTIEHVTAAIPVGAALLEMFRYRTFQPAKPDRRLGDARYVAYVLHRSGELSWVDLGDAREVDAAAENLRRALSDPSTDPGPAARALDAVVMQPVRALLRGVRRILLSPDGALAEVPFGALRDEEGRYLFERYTITYLSSGRDLVRLTETEGSRQGPVVIAAPDAAQGGERALEPPLHAREEARAVSGGLSGARLLPGAQATEAAVKALHGPRVLHLLADVFMEHTAAAHPQTSGFISLAAGDQSTDMINDGRLTIPELARLDLHGTRIVVLSACRTTAKNSSGGECLTGLRRVLVAAGAETQVLRLWSGDGKASRDLMTAYYAKLREGAGRSEAMRDVQFAMLGTPRAHPYYWSSFLVSGASGTLDGRLVPSDVSKVAPGPRGCTCSHASREDGFGSAGCIVTGGILCVLARRRRSRHDARRAISRAGIAWMATWLFAFALISSPGKAQPASGASGRAAADAAEGYRRALERLRGEGKFGEAILLAERVLMRIETKHGPEHRDIARVLDTLTELYIDRGDLRSAKLSAQRALEIRDKVFGPRSKEFALSLNNLASVHARADEHDQAVELFTRALTISEQTFGMDHPQVALMLSNLASALAGRGELDKTGPLFQRALDIRVKSLGPDHPDVAATLFNLALMHKDRSELGRAEALLQRCLTIREKTFGPEHLETIKAVYSLAELYVRMGDHKRAEPMLLRASSAHERAFGPEHPRSAADQFELANVYLLKHELLRAEQSAARALATREHLYGQNHIDVAASLSQMGHIYFEQRDHQKSRRYTERALRMQEELLGPDHPMLSSTLDNLAATVVMSGDYIGAQRLLEHSVAIMERKFGPEHRGLVTSLRNLGLIYSKRGEYDRAEVLFERVLKICERAFGPDSHHVASTLVALGGVYYSRGEYHRAESMMGRVLTIQEKTLGPEHAGTAESLEKLSLLHFALGRTALAVQLKERSSAIKDRDAMLSLAIGSEEQKRAVLEAQQRDTDKAISLHTRAAAEDPRASRLALTAILRRKGRVLFEQTSGFSMLREHLTKEDQLLLDQLTKVQSELASKLLRASMDSHPEQARSDPGILGLDERRRDIEAEISRRSSTFRAELQPVNVADVCNAIPEGAALVEIFRYWPLRARPILKDGFWDAPRYVAYVVRRDCKVSWADLGEATAVEARVERLRRALARPALDPMAPARELDAVVMKPLRALLGETRWVFISPDGALNLIPFSALVDEDGRFLVEQYSFTYLTSGRDLVRLGTTTWPRQGATVFAGPDFDATPAPQAPQDGRALMDSARAVAPGELSSMTFTPLRGAAEEGHAVRQALTDARLHVGAEATEHALKGVRAPRVLHIATHGFFLPRSDGGRLDGIHRMPWAPTSDLLPPVSSASNPMLRAGLALAGANRHFSGNDDGILTALEASSLDLYGTKLVVLSACETGLGEISTGEGLYGLRRALVMAGAETLVMSLWRVDDATTREVMPAYYAKLEAGGGRSEAMREVQLAMLQRDPGLHPHFWASFIVSGSPATLEGGTVTPRFVKVRPSPRGCACAATGQGGNDGWPGVLLASALIWTVARRRSRAAPSALPRHHPPVDLPPPHPQLHGQLLRDLLRPPPPCQLPIDPRVDLLLAQPRRRRSPFADRRRPQHDRHLPPPLPLLGGELRRGPAQQLLVQLGQLPPHHHLSPRRSLREIPQRLRGPVRRLEHHHRLRRRRHQREHLAPLLAPARQEPHEPEAPCHQPRRAHRRHHRRRPRDRHHPRPDRRGRAHQRVPRIAHHRRPRVGHERDLLPRLEVRCRPREVGLCRVLIQSVHRLPADPEVREQRARLPRVLREHPIDRAQHLHRAQRDVAEVPDRRGHHVERAPVLGSSRRGFLVRAHRADPITPSGQGDPVPSSPIGEGSFFASTVPEAHAASTISSIQPERRHARLRLLEDSGARLDARVDVLRERPLPGGDLSPTGPSNLASLCLGIGIDLLLGHSLPCSGPCLFGTFQEGLVGRLERRRLHAPPRGERDAAEAGTGDRRRPARGWTDARLE